MAAFHILERLAHPRVIINQKHSSLQQDPATINRNRVNYRQPTQPEARYYLTHKIVSPSTRQSSFSGNFLPMATSNDIFTTSQILPYRTSPVLNLSMNQDQQQKKVHSDGGRPLCNTKGRYLISTRSIVLEPQCFHIIPDFHQ
jgi:hypothetical protein